MQIKNKTEKEVRLCIENKEEGKKVKSEEKPKGRKHIQCFLTLKEANFLMAYAREIGKTQQMLLGEIIKEFILNCRKAAKEKEKGN